MSTLMNQMYDDARRNDALREARKSQLTRTVKDGRDSESRSLFQRSWFWRTRTAKEIGPALARPPVPSPTKP